MTDRAATQRRLKRIEGQVRGVQKMIDEGRACPDVLTQIAAVQEALRGVSRDLLRGHADRCLRKRGGHEELIDLLHRFTR